MNTGSMSYISLRAASLVFASLIASAIAGCGGAPDPAAGNPGYYTGPMAPAHNRSRFDEGSAGRAQPQRSPGLPTQRGPSGVAGRSGDG